MKLRPATIAALASFVILAVAPMACRSSSSSDKTSTASGTVPAVTSAPSKTRTPPAITTATSATSTVGIRALDLKAVPDVQKALTESGGQLVQSTVIYGDVTGDGTDEAIVPINSGGTLGDLGFFVLTPSGDATKTLLKEFPLDSPGLSVSVSVGKIVMTQPVPAPDDPNCCPSFLRHTTFAWNGSALAIESVTTDANPAGGQKPSPKPPVSTQ